ncbi:MAG: redoxin domain-containing protein [Cytophagales bacterium]|nr:redoxin domain-containing protein [Cytophaga sp.]
MKVTKNQEAPAFNVEDIYGKSLHIPFKGKKTLLCFMRFAGCPVCNLRVHELLKNAAGLEAANIHVVLVYESDKRVMLDYLMEEKFPFSFISDKEHKLYTLYSIEKSFGKFFSGMLKGTLSKVFAGKKLYKHAVSPDGSVSRINADFLIDEKGIVSIAHYGSYFGDELSVEKMLV